MTHPALGLARALAVLAALAAAPGPLVTPAAGAAPAAATGTAAATPAPMAAAIAAAPAAADSVLGTFTVDGKTAVFKHVYVTRAADPANPKAMYLSVLVSDVPLPDASRASVALAELARAGKAHAVRILWKEGFDRLTATPFHSAVADSGQPTAGGATIDLQAYDEQRLEAKIASRALGQNWHFSATLKAAVGAGALTAADIADPVPVVTPGGLERDTRVEKGRADPTAIKRDLGRLGYEATPEGFQHAVNDGQLDAVRHFLQLGMSPDSAPDGQALLLNAATLCTREPAGSRLAIVQALLAAHAKVDPKDENGSTPLLWAVNVGCPIDIVRALIAAGANVNVKAKGGGTPLMMATALQRAELVAVLKQAGAKQ